MSSYPEYKACDGDWITEIPKEWNIVRGKYLFDIKKRIVGELGHSVLSITQKGIKVKDTKSGDGQLSMDYSKYQIVECGDFAMNHMDLLTGYVDISSFKGVTSPDYRVFTIKEVARIPRFFLYLFQMGYTNKIFFKYGQGASHLGRWRLPTEEFNNFWFPCPPEKDREKIADFLDHEIAKIDTLIKKQQHLIKLLKEKRQAVISHAVTKGLNPDVPMRNSGVEWLGEVPEHWVSSELKYYARVLDCKHITAKFCDEGVPLASIGEVKERVVNLTTAKLTSEKYYLDLIDGDRKPSAGDIIYSRNATVGEAALVPANMPKFAMGQDVCLIRPDKGILPEYLLYVLESGVISNQLELAMVGSTFKRINVDNIRNFYAAWPCYGEQIEIVSEIDRILGKYGALILRAEATVDLIQERRTALISAAVTGKIDVRNWQAPEPTTNDLQQAAS